MTNHRAGGQAHRRGLLLTGLAVAAAGPAGAADPVDPRTSLRQTADYPSPPTRFYQALLSSEAFSAFSGMKATIEPKVGGRFSMFGGLVTGVTVELIPDRRIVQAWRLTEEFDPGVYSLVRFELTPTRAGVHVVLDHTGFPPGHYQHLYTGWSDRYWNPLHKVLG
jgi:activator of HSP90 ATPase